MSSVLLSFGVILGIVICIFGLKFQKAIVALVGCVVGFTLGNLLVNTFSVSETGLILVLKYGLALVCGACSFSLLELLLAIIVGVGLFIIISDIIGAFWYSYLIGVVVGVIGGLFTKKFYKLGVIIFTSLVGSYLVSNGITSFLGYSYYMVLGVVFIISVIIQLSINKV